MPGYVKHNCTETCPYPSYGEGCQKICNCSKNACDLSTGCRGSTSGM